MEGGETGGQAEHNPTTLGYFKGYLHIKFKRLAKKNQNKRADSPQLVKKNHKETKS